MTAPVDTDAVRELLDAATAGPWKVYTTMDAEDRVVEANGQPWDVVALPGYGRMDYGRADAALIAAAPTLLRQLADEVDRLRADYERLTERITQLLDGVGSLSAQKNQWKDAALVAEGERDEARAALDDVLSLHYNLDGECVQCNRALTNEGDSAEPVMFPCPTYLAATGGDERPHERVCDCESVKIAGDISQPGRWDGSHFPWCRRPVPASPVVAAETACGRLRHAMLAGAWHHRTGPFTWEPCPCGHDWNYLTPETTCHRCGVLYVDVAEPCPGCKQKPCICTTQYLLAPVTDAPTVQRDPACVERWPNCRPGEYDPRCCRFPKSCSADIAAPDAPTENGEKT